MSVSEIVKSAGDSWIICRSKSYSGRIYYFNTLTGKAVWNLSEPEIEKAKNTTKVLENHPDFKIVNCPEPSESPQDSHPLKQISVHQLMQPKIYNKQLLNNSFTKSQEKEHFLPYAHLPPIQFNIPIAPFNPSVWNANPQSILVAPSNISQPPFQHKSPFPMNKNNFVPSKTSMSLSNRFKTLCDSEAKLNSSSTRTLNKDYIRKKYINGNSKKNKFQNKSQASFYNTDLRALLTAKRRSFTQGFKNCHFKQFEEHTNKNNTQFLHESNNKIIPYDNDDDYWLQENLNIQANITKIDTTAVKNLFQVESSSSWYIVADSNVFLNHVNFINILMKSDPQCHLMIPQQVMNKIKAATNSRLRTQAHRAAYLISEKIDENVATIDQEDTEENILYKDTIINCCIKLIEEGNPVILLTDDIELHSSECSIPIYTVMEFKKILNNPKLHGFVPKNFESISLKHNRNIKITIENDATIDEVDQQSDNSDKEIVAYEYERHELDEHLKNQFNEQIKSPSPNAEIRFGHILNNIKLPEKKTGDIGVQADPTDLIIENDNNTNYPSNKNQSDNPEFAQTKPIKLKRQSSFDIAKPNKHFKLNKRKAVSSLSLISENSIIERSENITPFNLYPTQSMESIVNNETITDAIILNKHKSDGIIIKAPNIENSKTAKTFKNVRKFGDHNISQKSKNVMFEVTSQAMEDYLKMKCDEWTSRFVQIMEEVLTQVLQIDPPYVLDTMPPPWNIYEATECVKRRFNNVDDIHDAATQLSSILFEFGASRGKIKTDISPVKYMEMYSYGVYLIDTLQGHLNNVEDLHTAEQSLAKLLRDIQDPHLDPCNHDIFADNNAENQTICEEQDTLNETIESNENDCNNKNLNDIANNSSTPKTKSSNTSVVSSNYRLRSHKKKLLKESENNAVQEITFIRNINLKSSFFTNLNLKKNCELDSNNDVQDTVINDVENDNEMVNDSEVANNDTANDRELENNSSINNTAKEIELEENNANPEPKIIRNFTKCIEFEEKLKNNDLETDSLRDNWFIQSESDYTGNEELDYEDDEYFYDNDYDDYEYNDIQSENQLNDNTENKNHSFKLLMEKIQNEIKSTFLVLYIFCEKSYETLSSSESKESKTNIQILGKQSLTHVNSLCDALSSILSRDSSDCVLRLKELLKINNLDENAIDNSDIEEYTAFIKKCVEQGSLLRDSIKLVIDASEE